MENQANKKVEAAVENTDVKSNAEKALTPAEAVQKKADANSTLKKLRPLVSAAKLIEAGAHIGLRPSAWNPKMKQYIYLKRPMNHVIEVLKMLSAINRAFSFIQDITKEGGRILIVGTTGTALKELIKEQAKRGGCYYITQRWLGGTLTNFRVISKSIKKLNDNVVLEKTGEIEKYTKKEQVAILKETEKLNKFYGGIRSMKKLPNALIVTDPVHDKNAVMEAKKLGIPVIAFANTNADPSIIDYVIPMNNASIRSMTLVLSTLIDAIAELKNEPMLVVGKEDKDIILPEPTKRSNNFSKTRTTRTTDVVEKTIEQTSEVESK